MYSAHQQVQYTSRYLKSDVTKCFKKILETKRYKRLYKSKIKQLLQKKNVWFTHFFKNYK